MKEFYIPGEKVICGKVWIPGRGRKAKALNMLEGVKASMEEVVNAELKTAQDIPRAKSKLNRGRKILADAFELLIEK